MLCTKKHHTLNVVSATGMATWLKCTQGLGFAAENYADYHGPKNGMSVRYPERMHACTENYGRKRRTTFRSSFAIGCMFCFPLLSRPPSTSCDRHSQTSSIPSSFSFLHSPHRSGASTRTVQQHTVSTTLRPQPITFLFFICLKSHMWAIPLSSVTCVVVAMYSL